MAQASGEAQREIPTSASGNKERPKVMGCILGPMEIATKANSEIA